MLFHFAQWSANDGGQEIKPLYINQKSSADILVQRSNAIIHNVTLVSVSDDSALVDRENILVKFYSNCSSLDCVPSFFVGSAGIQTLHCIEKGHVSSRVIYLSGFVFPSVPVFSPGVYRFNFCCYCLYLPVRQRLGVPPCNVASCSCLPLCLLIHHVSFAAMPASVFH